VLRTSYSSVHPALERVSVEVPELPATITCGTIGTSRDVNSALTVTDND